MGTRHSGHFHCFASAFALIVGVAPVDAAVVVAELDGPITPIASEFVIRSLDDCDPKTTELFVLELDTPGGLEMAMRDIVKAFLRSPVPVAVFVGPAGARAASAGAIITMSAHVAAMAPGTNIGAAHPVSIGGGEIDDVMRAKIENDFVAYVSTLAETRGRNVEWARKAVLESVSATEDEALELGVIDLVVSSVDDLLGAIDGRSVEVEGEGPVTLRTQGPVVERVTMTAKERFLFVLSNPTLAYLLGILGAYGILFEFWNPGALFPAIVGGICILLAGIGFQLLPISWVGMGLILLGLVFFVLEVKVTSFGALSIGGVISMALGSVMLIEEPSLALPLWEVIVPVLGTTSGFFLLVAGFALRAQRRGVTTGPPGLIGMSADVREVTADGIRVFVNGEYWYARANGPVSVGEPVRVVSVDGMVLGVSSARESRES